MTLAEDLRAVLDNARSIAGCLGLHEHAVSILDGTWDGTGGNTGDGSETTISTVLLENGQNPKVKWLSDEQIALSDQSTGATVEIGPLTPQQGAVGVAMATLTFSAGAVADTHYVWIVGPKHPSGARYEVVEVRADSSLHRRIRCKPA